VRRGATSYVALTLASDAVSRARHCSDAALLPLAIVFLGFLALFLWVLAVGVVMAVRGAPSPAT
jgi:hypothetical protein